MIVEYIRYKVAVAQVDALLEAYRRALPHLKAAPGCLAVEVSCGVDAPGQVVVRIEWTSREAHEQGFRRGPHFGPFLALVGPFIPAIREMAHYEPEPSKVPSLSAWVGGEARLREVVERFYAIAKEDPFLAPIFSHVDAAHTQHVARFLDEVFGGPATYSAAHGGHHEMVRRHVGKHFTEEHRRRWLALWLRAADDVGLPDDPEFRSALTGYLEWGTRLAVINSQLETVPASLGPMPRWGWGPVGGPFTGT